LNKKNLAIICSSAFSLINFRYELICELNKKFYIDTFSEDRSQKVSKKLKKKKISNETYGVKLKINFLINQVISLINFVTIFYFKKKKYDYYFVYSIKAILFSAFLNFKNSKVIFLVTGLGFLFKNNNKNLLKKCFKFLLMSILRKSLKKNNLIFFQNKDDKKVFLKRKLINKNNKIFIMNGSGVNISKFNFQKKFPKQFTVLMISRIVKDKGIDVFFEAAEKLKEKNENIHFVFCGQTHTGVDSYNFDIFEKKIKELNIKLIVNSSKIKDIIKNSSVVVLPSPYREGVPRSLLEAISIGRPVIGTNVPGIKEVIKHSWNGFFMRKKSSSDLVRYILKLKADKNKFSKLCYNARKLAVKKFEVKKVNQVFLSKIYKY
tara:strand:- start:2096 stop:3226 length:1131 start_codon:yes stop_codon:yes gene_type:complete